MSFPGEGGGMSFPGEGGGMSLPGEGPHAVGIDRKANGARHRRLGD